MAIDFNKLFKLNEPFRTDADLDELFSHMTYSKEVDFEGFNRTIVLDDFGGVNDFSLFVQEDRFGNLFIKQYDNHSLPLNGMTPVRYITASKGMMLSLVHSFYDTPTQLSIADSERGM